MIEKAYPHVQALIGNLTRRSAPFRDRYEHTLRVLNWTRRLQKAEGGDMDILTLAVLFHDSGWEEGVPHAEVGARLAREFLEQYQLDEDFVERVVLVVLNHNQRYKDIAELSVEEAIMMDADILDELGATTFIWDAMSTALGESPSYQKALAKSQKFIEGYKEKSELVKTETGQKYYQERLAVYEYCVEQLAYELEMEN
jgi:uncharacterized protein